MSKKGFFVACAWVCSACGGAGVGASGGAATPGRPVADFPARASVEALAARPVALPDMKPALEVDRWTMDQAKTAPSASYPLENHWDRLLVEALDGTISGKQPAAGQKLAPELRCAANEVARFYVENGAYPNDALRMFLGARCGSTLPRIGVAYYQATVPEGYPPGRLENDFDSGVKELLEKVTAVGGQDFGVGFARARGRAAVVVLSGVRGATLEGYSPLIEGVGVTLRGQIVGQGDVASGLVSQGNLGVRPCEADPSVSLPRFQFFCPIASDDATARVELVVRKEKSVLYDSVLHALVRRTDDAGLEYRPLVFGADAVATDATAFREALYGALNDARKAAGAPPLQVEPRQASWNDRIAPALYQATFTGDRTVGERAALGMLAGWEVNGMIRDAGLFVRVEPMERRPARWLAAALDRPFGRLILLDRSMSRVAVGTTDMASSAIGAVVTTYSVFDNSDHAAAVAKFQALLTAQRAAIGKPRPKFRPASEELLAALARIEREGISAQSALQDAVNQLAQARGVSVSGASFETIDLRELHFPSELVASPTLDIEIGITHYKPAGAAWGQYAVLVVCHPVTA